MQTEKIIKNIFKGLALALPLFFLPWTASALGMDNFNKQLLLWLVVPAGFMLLIFNGWLAGGIRLRRTRFDWPVLLVLAAALAGAIVSYDRYASFFGSHGFINLPVISLLVLAVFYFTAVNWRWQSLDIARIFIWLFAAWAAVLSFLFLQLFDVWSIIFKNNQFIKYFVSGFGNLEDLSIYLAVMTVSAAAFIIHYRGFPGINKRWFWLLSICLALSLGYLAIINFTPAWLVLLAGSLYLYYRSGGKLEAAASGDNRLWHKLRRSFFQARTGLLALIISISLFILIFSGSDSQINSNKRYAKNMQLDHATSLEIAIAVFKNEPLTGYGPENFNYAYSQLRADRQNNSEFWSLRYFKGGSFMLDYFINNGLLGILSYLALLAAAVFAIFRTSQAFNPDTPDRAGAVLASTLLTALIVAQFVYSANMVLLWLFWLGLALMAVILNFDEGGKEIMIKKDGSKLIYSSAAGLILLIVIAYISLIAYGAKIWVAEYNFQKGSDNISSIQKAADLNPQKYNYQISLAKAYLSEAIKSVGRDGTVNDPAAFQDNINKSINSAKKAINAAPGAVIPYEVMGMIYREIGRYSPDSQNLARQAFARAVELEPTNPVLHTELGKTYLAMDMNAEAIKEFRATLLLKPDYYEAQFYLAKTLAKSGNNSQAIIELKDISGKYNEIEVFYEMGMAYYNEKKYDQAIGAMREAVDSDPLNANALYVLALSLEASGNIDEALKYFKQVSALNADNIEVKNKIESLEKK